MLTTCTLREQRKRETNRYPGVQHRNRRKAGVTHSRYVHTVGKGAQTEYLGPATTATMLLGVGDVVITVAVYSEPVANGTAEVMGTSLWNLPDVAMTSTSAIAGISAKAIVCRGALCTSSTAGGVR